MALPTLRLVCHSSFKIVSSPLPSFIWRMGCAGWKHQQLFLTAALLPSRHSGDAPGAEATGRSVRKPNTGNTLLGRKKAKAWVRFCTPLCREGMPPGWGVWWIHDVSAYVLEEGFFRAPEESVSCLLSVLQSPPVLLLSLLNVEDQILFVYIHVCYSHKSTITAFSVGTLIFAKQSAQKISDVQLMKLLINPDLLPLFFICCLLRAQTRSPNQELEWEQKAAPTNDGQKLSEPCPARVTCPGLDLLQVEGTAWVWVYPGGKFCIYPWQGRKFFLGWHEEIVSCY